MLKVAFHTLGCKVNQYETESMMGQFQKKGYDIVDFHDTADIYVINTCTVTHLSDRKSRQMLRRAKRTNPEALVVAVGCYAQIAPEVLQSITEVDLILGNIDKNKVVEIVEDREEIKHRLHIGDIYKIEDYEEMRVYDVHETTRAFIKIQDGCNQYCSYCIIPYARGKVRSRHKEQIYEEVVYLAGKGYQEIVLTGIHIGSYGTDLEDISLFELVRYLHDIPGIKRIRLGSLEQEIINDLFEEIVPDIGKLCPHFHLSLQSGSDEILKKMNRKYSTTEYSDRVRRIRRWFPDASITTDIIVGFPGETDELFSETLEFVQSMAFSDVHVFKYSKREGTPAASMMDQIDERVKTERSIQLIKEVEKLRRKYFDKHIDEVHDILFENHHGTEWYGHATNYMKVTVESLEDLSNQILPIRLIDVKNDHIIGCLQLPESEEMK
jgi:threonylcarbamoyladenosine tRNA methylthiotransferase MtaB